jgi:hypothetical protein
LLKKIVKVYRKQAPQIKKRNLWLCKKLNQFKNQVKNQVKNQLKKKNKKNKKLCIRYEYLNKHHEKKNNDFQNLMKIFSFYNLNTNAKIKY